MSQSSIAVLNESNKKTLDFLHEEFMALQLGRASTGLVENISIDSYGAHQPLKNIANIGVEGPQTLTISPWDKSLLAVIEKAIRENDALGLSPLNDGVCIRLNIPALTKERRQDLTKLVAKMGEEAKVSVRKHRHTALDNVKKEELSEDEQKAEEKKIQEATDTINKQIDESVKAKQADVMKV
jgi:ribosome recycling factor